MDWFRSYHGAPSDTKLALIAIASGQPRAFVTAVWWEVLDHASRNVTHGHARGDVSNLDPEIVAYQQGLVVDQVTVILTAMRDRGMIADGRVAAWEQRQPKREDGQAAERKRLQRERAREGQGRDSLDGDCVTQGHATSRDVTLEEKREEESREEKKEKISTASPPEEAPGVPDVPPDGVTDDKRGKRLLAYLKNKTEITEEFLFEATARGFSLEGTKLVWTEFIDYWRGVPGQKGVKLDWPATWRNALKTIYAGRENAHPSRHPARPDKPTWQSEGARLRAKYAAEAEREEQGDAGGHAGEGLRLAEGVWQDPG